MDPEPKPWRHKPVSSRQRAAMDKLSKRLGHPPLGDDKLDGLTRGVASDLISAMWQQLAEAMAAEQADRDAERWQRPARPAA